MCDEHARCGGAYRHATAVVPPFSVHGGLSEADALGWWSGAREEVCISEVTECGEPVAGVLWCEVGGGGTVGARGSPAQSILMSCHAAVGRAVTI